MGSIFKIWTDRSENLVCFSCLFFAAKRLTRMRKKVSSNFSFSFSIYRAKKDALLLKNTVM